MGFQDLRIKKQDVREVYYDGSTIDRIFRDFDILKITDLQSAQAPLWVLDVTDNTIEIYRSISFDVKEKQDVPLTYIRSRVDRYFKQEPSKIVLISFNRSPSWLMIPDAQLHQFFPDYNPHKSLEEKLAHALQPTGIFERAASSPGTPLAEMFFVSVNGQTYQVGVGVKATDVPQGAEVIALPAPAADKS